MDLLEWANDRPLFTVNEAHRATGLARSSLLEKLSRMARRGDLLRVERGKYTVHEDPMVYASYIEVPSYVSFWSGLRYYDLTTQQPTAVQVVSASNRANLQRVEFYTMSALFGFGRKRYDSFEIFVADPARLLIDTLSRSVVPVDALGELIESVDIDTVIAYANRLDRLAVKKRLGYLFEAHRDITIEEFRVDDRNYPQLDLSRAAAGPTNARWRLRVNADVT